MFLAFNCQSGNELQLEKNWAIFFSGSNPVLLRVDNKPIMLYFPFDRIIVNNIIHFRLPSRTENY